MFRTIRLVLKKVFDRLPNEKIKQNLMQAVPFWIASLLTGLISVFYSVGFSKMESITFYIYDHYKAAIFILTPVCFLIGWWIVYRFAPNAKGSGIPQVMAAVELANPRDDPKISKLLSLRIIFVKIISGLLMILGGGAVGKEGPTIQIAGAVFRKVNEWLPSWWTKISKKNMIMTGAAAGLAAAFNTPLGGIVFAVEELTKTHISYFKTALFTAIIISGLTAQALLGPYLYLGFPAINHISNEIFFALILISATAAAAGSFMSRIIMKIFRWKAGFRFKYQHFLYVLGCALLMAGIAYFLDPEILGSGRRIMASTLFTPDKEVPWYTAFFRVFGIVASFATGSAGGIFAPSLSAGAAIGSYLAGVLHFTADNANLLILCGMVSFLTGVTHTPFTSAILVLEMTDRHSVIFHLMIAGLVANLVSLIIDKHSLYDRLKVQILHDAYHGKENKSKREATKLPDLPSD